LISRSRKIAYVSTTERVEFGLVVLGLILIAAGAFQARFRYVGGRHRGRRFRWSRRLCRSRRHRRLRL